MAISLTMKTTILTAVETNAMAGQKQRETDSESIQPDEAFLEFLALMTEINGKMIDPLDMLEMTEDDTITLTTDDLNSEKIMNNDQPNDQPNEKTTAKETR